MRPTMDTMIAIRYLHDLATVSVAAIPRDMLHGRQNKWMLLICPFKAVESCIFTGYFTNDVTISFSAGVHSCTHELVLRVTRP